MPPPDPAGGETSEARVTTAPSWRSWAVAAAVAAVVAIGGIAVLSHRNNNASDATPASAQSPANPGGGEGGNRGGFGQGGGQGFFGRGARGEITKIDGDTFTVKATDRNGDTSNVTVETDSATTYRDQVKGKVGDLAKGDTVLVVGSRSNGSIAADAIREGDGGLGGFGRRQSGGTGNGSGSGTLPTPPEGGPFGGGQGGQGGPFGGGFAAGTITQVDGSTLTVKTMAGDTVEVTTSADTTIVLTKDITLSDLAKGDTVRVLGETDGDTVTARSVVRGEDGVGFGGGGFGGRGPGANTGTPGGTGNGAGSTT